MEVPQTGSANHNSKRSKVVRNKVDRLADQKVPFLPSVYHRT